MPKLKDNFYDAIIIGGVPCMIINDEHVHFGKKNIAKVLSILENI